MNQKTDNPSGSPLENLKIAVAVVALVASLAGYYSYDDAHAVVRVLGLIAGIVVAGFVFYQSDKGKAWFSYVSHAQKEVKQVIWPTRQETTQMTLIVFVAVIIMSIFLWLVDMFFLWGVQILTGQGG